MGKYDKFQFDLEMDAVKKYRNNPDFVVCAWTAEGEIMGVRHKEWPLFGVQFHPESFLTLEGPKLLKNFLDWPATTNTPAKAQTA